MLNEHDGADANEDEQLQELRAMLGPLMVAPHDAPKQTTPRLSSIAPVANDKEDKLEGMPR